MNFHSVMKGIDQGYTLMMGRGTFEFASFLLKNLLSVRHVLLQQTLMVMVLQTFSLEDAFNPGGIHYPDEVVCFLMMVMGSILK